MNKEKLIINASEISFWLLVIENIILVGCIAYFSIRSPFFTYLQSWGIITNILLFILVFAFVISALAFLILPADLVLEKEKNELLKFKKLLPMLLWPLLYATFYYLTSSNYSFILDLKATSSLWYVGGVLSFVVGLLMMEKTIKNKIITLFTFGIILLCLAGFVYQNIWSQNWFTNWQGLAGWHISLLFYTMSVIQALKYYSLNDNNPKQI